LNLLSPQTEAECADVIRAARQDAQRLEIRGAGTKNGLGRPMDVDAVLSTAALSGIISYNPAEMVMTAQAGATLASIEAALAEHRHMLAFEPPDLRGLFGAQGEPTVGGLFACNLSGPRRFQAGAARDHLLGVRFVNGSGETIQAGGRVMKNVTGLDLVKLMAGSFGTLGLMTELTFKVLPRPFTEASLVLFGLDDRSGALAMAHAMTLSMEVSGAAYIPESCRYRFLGSALPEGAATVLRLEGQAFSVAERMAKLKAAFAKTASASVLAVEPSAALWRDIRDVRPFHADGRNKPVWKVSVAPAAGHQLLSALRMQTGVDGYYDWQGGLLWLRMESGPEADLVRSAVKQAGGGHATLMRATDIERAIVAVFEPEAPAIALLSERIRRSMDPAGLFNPGRMNPAPVSDKAA